MFAEREGLQSNMRGILLAFAKPSSISLGIHAFVAIYVALKLPLTMLRATDALERWTFELTPLAAVGLQDVGLLAASAAVATAGMAVHYAGRGRQLLMAMGLTGSMVASLILALRTSPYYFDSVNTTRFLVLGILLLTLYLDHFTVLGRGAPRPASEARPFQVSLPEGPEAIEPMYGPMATQPTADVMGPAAAPMASTDEVFSLEPEPEAEPGPSPAATAEVTTFVAEPEDENDVEGLLKELEMVAAEGKASSPPPPDDVLEGTLHVIGGHKDLYERRVESMNLALEIDPEDTDALFARATYLATRREFAEALQTVEAIVRINPNYPGVWYLKAKLHQLMGDQAAAERAQTRASSFPE